jgi:predicted ribosome quality control (RQC) complex YloA/Tae2 family protein
MDWIDISRLIEAEQGRGNAVASMMKLPLKLYENTVTLLLGEAEKPEDQDSGYDGSDTESEAFDSDEDSSNDRSNTLKAPPKRIEDQRLTIDIDLALTPWANASQYYDQKKSAAVKENKTVQASTLALKSTERKIAADLKKGLDQEKEVLRPTRKQFWFEKFYYFISSDGYLTLAGKDAQQNDLLYRRYLKKGDVYVHADLHGAATVVIKNNPSTPDAPVPPSTLSQAGNFSVAASNAWDSKAVMSAYWVNADQVSKTAPTGEYLTIGGFMVRGKKNYLPPAQLLLGFAVMWQISEESKANHRKHRIEMPREDSLQASTALLVVEDEEVEVEVEVEDESRVDDGEDSDDEFPDAKIETKHADSDDEDFPDAKIEQPTEDSDSEDEGGNAAHNANPLQSGSANASKNDDKQELESDNNSTDREDGNETAQALPVPSKPQQRHLTAKERQQLKSGNFTAISDDETASITSKTTTATQKPKSQPLPRGKRGKQKKAAAKYADQDPEERELAMRLLGSKTGQDAAVEAAESRKAKLEEEEKQKRRRREQHQKAQDEGKKAEAARQAKLEGTSAAVVEYEEETETLEEMGLDAFTGRPLPGDELLAAIPVCAPWSALAMYKYKVKLQPGPLKKGKAISQILDTWQRDGKDTRKVDRASQDAEMMWPREAELIKGLKQTEVVGVIPVKGVRVMLSGAGSAKGGSGGGGGKAKKQAGKGGGGGKGKKK